MVDPFPVPQAPGALPLLPKLKRAAISSHRHEANPALAMSMLQEIQQMVSAWQQELQAIVVDIQNLYLEGPIVDGWLESCPTQAEQRQSPPSQVESMSGLDAAVLRHGDAEQLMTYVDRLYQGQSQETQPQNTQPQETQQQNTQPQDRQPQNTQPQETQPQNTAVQASFPSPSSPSQPLAHGPHYQLCGLDEEGKLRCQPCPPAQMPAVSVAIARNQRLRQFLSQKQYLEARLKRAVDSLTQVRRDLQMDTPDPFDP